MKKLDVINPYNLEKIEEIEFLSKEAVTKSLDLASNIFQDKKKLLPKYERIGLLKRFGGLLKGKKEAIVNQALLEGGKPYKDSAIEFDRGLNGVEIAVEELSNLSGREIPMNISDSSKNRSAYTNFAPRGVVTAVSAFNHPINLIIHQVIPAIAAGCPVIVKPASTTPLSCRTIVETLYEAGLDKGLCQLVVTGNEVAEQLITSSKVSFFSFVGSGRVGWYLRSRLAAGADCALEHGGVAPVIVDESADLEHCVASLLRGGYYHAGQVCVSVQRIFVHKNISQKFTNLFTEKIKTLKVGDPKNKDTDVGPLILPKEVDRVHSWVSNSLDQGAELLVGGKKLSETMYAPTLLKNVSNKCELATKEVFGPVVIVNEFTDINEAIKASNSLNLAFQAAIFTQNLNNAQTAAMDLEGMAIMINDHTAFRVDWMPFGGYKESGLKVGGIGHSIRDMSLEKMVVSYSEAFRL